MYRSNLLETKGLILKVVQSKGLAAIFENERERGLNDRLFFYSDLRIAG
jgi:hypothetical protein